MARPGFEHWARQAFTQADAEARTAPPSLDTTVLAPMGHLSPELLPLDEVGSLPIDQHGADLLFQVASQRYKRGSIVLTTNQPFKQWAAIFNHDSTPASAVLGRLLHHAEPVGIEGSSSRMKDQTNP